MIKNAKNIIFLLLKTLKNTESAQLCMSTLKRERSFSAFGPRTGLLNMDDGVQLGNVVVQIVSSIFFFPHSPLPSDVLTPTFMPLKSSQSNQPLTH